MEVLTKDITEVVQLRGTVQGSWPKDLLVNAIRKLVIDAGVQAFVIVIIKIVGHAGLRVG